VGPEDAGILAREFQPKFEVEDLINLPNRDIYLKLVIDGTPSSHLAREPWTSHRSKKLKSTQLKLLLDRKSADRTPVSGVL